MRAKRSDGRLSAGTPAPLGVYVSGTAVERGKRQERKPRGAADVLGGDVVERNRVAEAALGRMLGAGEKARFRGVIAADFGMRDAREDRELVAEVAQNLQILAGLVVATRLVGEERRAVQAETGADADQSLRWRGFVGTGTGFQPGECQTNRGLR